VSRSTTVTGGRSHRFSHELWLERKKKRMRWPAWRVWHAWQVRSNWALTRNQERVQWTTTMARERHRRRGAACPGGVSPALQVDLTEFHEPHHAAGEAVVGWWSCGDSNPGPSHCERVSGPLGDRCMRCMSCELTARVAPVLWLGGTGGARDAVPNWWPPPIGDFSGCAPTPA
jgi:hypothetical protein